jgi:hypothetical protein
LWQTHTPVVLPAVAAPLLVPGLLTALLAGLILVNLACYLPYAVFNDWTYLRFLLPAIPLLLVLAAAAMDAIGRWLFTRIAMRVSSVLTSPLREAGTRAVLGIVTVLVAFFLIREARDRSVFDLQRLEARYEKAGTFVATRLPPNALVITSWESGSVRFYSGRPTLVWDVLDPAWLDRALDFVRTRGFEPYLLFERWEEPAFRRRFGGTGIAALDWPPAAEVAAQVRIYRPADRETYSAGRRVVTEYVR